jgi:aryl-alcohol dehydrogenase-like predicted oxidoreductase
MHTRHIGPFEVAEIGLGCMNLSHAYASPPPPEEGAKLIHRALELGVTHFDTAALYGFGANEALVGAALEGHRDRVVLASKCGMTGVDGKRVIDGRPETILKTCEESLRRLRTEVIDLYYLHRWDKRVPIEDSVGALAQLVAKGSVRAIGLSEVSAATLRKAHAVHPIAAVQSEYSLWTRNPEIAMLEACRELGVTFVAFSPLGRGFLAGGVTHPAALNSKDIRSGMPRFQEPAFSRNRVLFAKLQEIATAYGSTPAQLSIAWLLHKAPHIVPIVGTTNVAHLEEDLGAAQITLSPAVIDQLEALINQRTVVGARYPAATQLEIDTEES